jgi:hypothetical protein
LTIWVRTQEIAHAHLSIHLLSTPTHLICTRPTHIIQTHSPNAQRMRHNLDRHLACHRHARAVLTHLCPTPTHTSARPRPTSPRHTRRTRSALHARHNLLRHRHREAAIAASRLQPSSCSQYEEPERKKKTQTDSLVCGPLETEAARERPKRAGPRDERAARQAAVRARS